MIDISNNYDIINPSVRSADFLCQHSPLVCAVELNRSSDRRRKGAFLLEENMPKGFCGFQKGHPVYTTKGNFKKGHKTWNKGKKMPIFWGKNHPNWKGGKDITTNGYVRLQVNGNPILEHRLFMMKKLKRKLKRTECVHHINGIKTDNRIENLMLIERGKHTHKFHSRIFRGGSEIRKCFKCKKTFKTFLSNNSVFCSHKCYHKERKGKSKTIIYNYQNKKEK